MGLFTCPINICCYFSQYSVYDYDDSYDYIEGELTTDAPPTSGAKTEVNLD